MRAIVCERCGSEDVVERNGGLRCEACGVRYVAEGGGAQTAGVACTVALLRTLDGTQLADVLGER